jgi:hypothetical protein
VVGDETGIKEIEENGLAISMYPNPANGTVSISYYLNNAQNVNLELFNSLGQKVYGANQGITSAGQHSLVLNVQQFEPAVYFMRITTDNATTVKKLVIQR